MNKEEIKNILEEIFAYYDPTKAISLKEYINKIEEENKFLNQEVEDLTRKIYEYLKEN